VGATRDRRRRLVRLYGIVMGGGCSSKVAACFLDLVRPPSGDTRHNVLHVAVGRRHPDLTTGTRDPVRAAV